MYQVNLLPWRPLQRKARYLLWIKIACSTFILLLLSFVGLHFYLQQQIEQQIGVVAALQQEDQQLIQHFQQIQDKRKQLQNLQRLQQTYQQYQQQNQYYVLLLTALSHHIPETIWLTDVKQRDGVLLISGISPDYPTVIDFMAGMDHITFLLPTRMQQLRTVDQGQHAFSLSSAWPKGAEHAK